MLEMGFLVMLGMAVMYAKLSVKSRLWVNSHPLFMDLAVFVLLNVLHWGTFSGTMVAAVGALFCSITISLARKWIGYMDAGQYFPGWIDVRRAA